MKKKQVLQNSYKGFEFISSTYVPDCSGYGIYLRHKKTGLEVFHILNDDEENLFAFAFRTPVKNSKGGAHILEHSVLCGSEKYPLREPFANLMNQSINTFLNAMTYPDKTVYPASSTVKADYFNIMNVYGDAVFFPLLRKDSFHQEAHRLEIDEEGKYSIQGVVYNEMKGAYSNFDSVAGDYVVHSLFKNTNYEYDSGGDPLCIPDFSYEDFKNFHKKYYSPSNCLVFLCGNIPTEEQLDFLQENFLDRLEKDFSVPFNDSKNPVISSEISEMEKAADFSEPLKLQETGPGKESSGSTVTINWRCGKVENLEETLECVFLNEILTGHDGSPLSKLLLDCGLGDDMAPSSGVISDMRNNVINYGLHGVKSENVQKVYDLILNELKRLSESGVSRQDIDSTLMAIEFSNREVLRVGGPFSLVYLDRALLGWNYGIEPALTLKYRETFEKIREKAENNPDYVQKLIKKVLLENKNCTFLEVKPSEDFQKNRKKKEDEIVEKQKNLTDERTVLSELESMHEYQQHKESEEEVSCIPFTNPDELSRAIRSNNCEMKLLEDSEKNQMSFVKCVQNTNGISYFYAAFPLDAVPPEDYQYLNLFSICFCDVGFDGKDWAQCAQDAAVSTGGFSTRLFSTDYLETEESRKLVEKMKEYNVHKRDWFMVSGKTISEKLEEGLKLFAKILTTVDFSDVKRIKTILEEYKASMESAIVPQGNRFMLKRADRNSSHQAAFSEVTTGITQYFKLQDFMKTDINVISRKLIEIQKKVLESGAFIYAVSDSDTMEKFEKLLPSFIKEAKLKKLSPKSDFDEEKFRSLMILPGEKDEKIKNECFKVSTQVGYSSAGYPMAVLGTKENAAEVILAKYLSGTLLWEKLRTSGGAYGASASTCGYTDGFFCSTYRDPSPEKSIQVFGQCFKIASEERLSDIDLKRLLAGNYGDGHQPRSPYGEGWVNFIRFVSALPDEDRKHYVAQELEVTAEEVQQAAERLYKYSLDPEKVVSAIMIDNSVKTEKNAGVIVNLPL